MRICVLGGSGYVGSALVPVLTMQGHTVTVMDTHWYSSYSSPLFSAGDMRFEHLCRLSFQDQDALIHLACISNDPSFELNPELARSVNGPETMKLVLRSAKECGIKRVIYASSSSVYGVKPDGVDVNESAILEPLTDYSKMKILCENVLTDTDFDWTILRPATVCGWAPRLRLDVVVNAMTASALRKGIVRIDGGPQIRPNILIDDMVKAYQAVLEDEKSFGQIYNVGADNLTLSEIGKTVAKLTHSDVVYQPTNDVRSYKIDSSKFAKDFFRPKYPIIDAVKSIRENLFSGMQTVNITRLKELIDAGSIQLS